MDSNNSTAVKEFTFLAFSTSTTSQHLIFTLFFFTYLFIIFLNALLIVVIKIDSNLHTPMYFFIFNLACLDIFFTSTVIPQTLNNLLSPKHSISFIQCALQMLCIIISGGTQIFLVTAMAYDRYVAITNPLRYKIVMNWAVCKMFLSISWLMSSAIGFAMVFSVFLLPFCEPFEINHFYCDVGEVFRLTCPSLRIHDIVQMLDLQLGFCMFTVPFLLVALSYVYIISAIIKISTNEGRRKAFFTCSSHLTIVFVEYIFMGVIFSRTETSHSGDNDRILIVTFTLGVPILNPLVYSVRNRAVKSGFLKLSYIATASV